MAQFRAEAQWHNTMKHLHYKLMVKQLCTFFVRKVKAILKCRMLCCLLETNVAYQVTFTCTMYQWLSYPLPPINQHGNCTRFYTVWAKHNIFEMLPMLHYLVFTGWVSTRAYALDCTVVAVLSECAEREKVHMPNLWPLLFYANE